MKRSVLAVVDDCLLDLHLQHPPLERAHYTGELRYPGPEGEVVERISLDCIALFDLGGGCQ